MALPNDEFWQAEQDALAEILKRHLLAAAREGGNSGAADLGDTVSIDFALVNTAVRAWAESMSLDLVRGITDTSRRFTTQAIADWIASGAPLDDLIAALEPMFGPNRASLVASTEVTRAYQAGNVEAWRASGVVDGVRWNTAVDELVCPTCGPLNGQTDTLDGDFGGVGQPPAHPRCRCWSVPVVNL